MVDTKNTKRSEIHSKTAKLYKRGVAFKSMGEKSCEIKGNDNKFNNDCSELYNLLSFIELCVGEIKGKSVL